MGSCMLLKLRKAEARGREGGERRGLLWKESHSEQSSDIILLFSINAFSFFVLLFILNTIMYLKNTTPQTNAQ